MQKESLSWSHHSLSTQISDSGASPTNTIRSRLTSLCRQGKPHIARQLFLTLPRTNTNPLLWNIIIIGFISNNLPNEALSFYCQMKTSSHPSTCDSYTYSSILKASATTHNLRFGKAVHSHLLRLQSNPTIVVYNSLLNMYSMCLSSNTSWNSSCSGNAYVLKVLDTMPERNVVSWNTVISWYVKTERYAEAVELFCRMMKMRMKPTVVSFVNVFPAAFGLRDHKIADVLYGLVLHFGSEYANDLFLVSSAVHIYAELGFLEFARKIFNRCSEKNMEVWNTMIGGYVENNYPVEGLSLLSQAIESKQRSLDEVSFLYALHAISQLQQLELAEQLHAYVLKGSASLPVNILNAIIFMYSRCNSIETSLKVFHKMPERDIVSWNTMISAFVENNLDDEALLLAHNMQKQRFMIDSVTATVILSAASNLRDKDIGKQIHAYLIRHSTVFKGMEGYLIEMYAKSGLIRASEWLFNNNCVLDRDHSPWNAITVGYTQNGLYEEAFFTFRKMLEKNVIPNDMTITSILPSCSSMGSIVLVKQFHGFSVRNGLDQNVYVGTALVDTYSKSGSITCAEKVFMEMPEKNSVTYTTMASGYGHHGMGVKALSLFHSMQGSSIKPDDVMFVAVLSACGSAGLVDEGIEIFQNLKGKYNIQPSTEHYCCIADMLGRAGRVDEAYEFVKRLGQEGNVLEIWGSLLGACRYHDHFELGKAISNKLLEMETKNDNTGYHVLLSNMYAEEGEWENVYEVRRQMKEKGLQKETGCSWIENLASVNCSVSRDQKHPEFHEICDMLETLTMDMNDPGYRQQESLYQSGI